jgi:hypothetical protein
VFKYYTGKILFLKLIKGQPDQGKMMSEVSYKHIIANLKGIYLQ